MSRTVEGARRERQEMAEGSGDDEELTTNDGTPPDTPPEMGMHEALFDLFPSSSSVNHSQYYQYR